MGEGGVTYFDSNSCFGNWHKLIIPLVNGLLTKNQLKVCLFGKYKELREQIKTKNIRL